MMEERNETGGVEIGTTDELSRGRYSNSMLVSHGPEEFIIDWLVQTPNGAHLVSRIIVNPAHMKRIIAALHENATRYEQEYGAIAAPSGGMSEIMH